MIRLTIILNKCENKKYRTGYIKYLKSLEFDEFENIFSHYSAVMATLLMRYKKIKTKFFSKKWIKLQAITYKWQMLYLIFSHANDKYVRLVGQNLEIRNSKKMELISKINETRQALDSIVSYPIKMAPNPKIDDIVRFDLILVDSIYISEELNNLIDELNNIK